jgi:spermidine synthase
MRKIQVWIIFLTGLTALVYEICWVRQATLIFGVSIFAYSAVLTAYMGGMAIGNYLFGKIADNSRNLPQLFATLQVGLAVTGVLALFLLSGLSEIYISLVQLIHPNKIAITLIRLILALVAMTPPAIFIGGMMPVMTRSHAYRNGLVGHDVGRVYFINTLGSVVGCGMTAVFFIRWFGLCETIILAAGINVLLGVIIFQSSRKISIQKYEQRKTSKSSFRHKKPSSTLTNFVLYTYAISGFTALGYEIIWARIISLHTVGAIYSFSVMLTVFLSGLTLGGFFGTRWLRQRTADIKHFSILEIGIGTLVLVVLPVFSQINRLSLEAFFGTYRIGTQIIFESMLSFITLFPVTVLIGMVFPVASSLYTSEKSGQVGFSIGKVISLNTLGSILGSLLTGFILIPAFGLQLSTFILASLNVLIGAAASWIFLTKEIQLRFASMVAILVIILLGIFLPTKKYLGYWESVRDVLVFYEEGVETTVAVFSAGSENPKFSTVNGRVEVPTDVLSMRAFYLLGHLPAILMPDAQNALMLSFGNGIATGALATHEVPKIDVVELAPEMIHAAEFYTEENRNILNYPGLGIHIEDARNYLLQTDLHFDIITTDATHPANSSSWTLFTKEFYQDVKDHLEVDGIFLQWVPIHSLSINDYISILRTFQDTFPNATLWYTGGSHTLLLATPENLTPEFIHSKLDYLDSDDVAVQDLGTSEKITRHWIMNSDQLREFSQDGVVVKDNDAFFMPINSEMGELIQIIQLAAIRSNQ